MAPAREGCRRGKDVRHLDDPFVDAIDNDLPLAMREPDGWIEPQATLSCKAAMARCEVKDVRTSCGQLLNLSIHERADDSISNDGLDVVGGGLEAGAELGEVARLQRQDFGGRLQLCEKPSLEFFQPLTRALLVLA